MQKLALLESGEFRTLELPDGGTIALDFFGSGLDDERGDSPDSTSRLDLPSLISAALSPLSLRRGGSGEDQ